MQVSKFTNTSTASETFQAFHVAIHAPEPSLPFQAKAQAKATGPVKKNNGVSKKARSFSKTERV